MRDASVSMKKVAGFHFVYKVDRPKSAQPGPGFELISLTGEVNAAGNMQATAEGTQAGKAVQQKLLVVDGTVYVQDPVSAKWHSVATAESPVAGMNVYRGMTELPGRLTDISDEGRAAASPSGVPSEQISGKLAVTALPDIVGAVTVSGSIPVDIWAFPPNGYIYDLQLTGALNPGEDPATTRTISLSDFDKSPDIQAPE
jgi:hypothetical protein